MRTFAVGPVLPDRARSEETGSHLRWARKCSRPPSGVKDSENLGLPGQAEDPIKVHARSVPVVIEKAPLNGVSGAIGIEKADAFSLRPANASIDDAVGSPVRVVFVGARLCEMEKQFASAPTPPDRGRGGSARPTLGFLENFAFPGQ